MRKFTIIQKRQRKKQEDPKAIDQTVMKRKERNSVFAWLQTVLMLRGILNR